MPRRYPLVGNRYSCLEMSKAEREEEARDLVVRDFAPSHNSGCRA